MYSKEVHGHCDVSYVTHADNLPLANWVKRQRVSGRSRNLLLVEHIRLKDFAMFAIYLYAQRKYKARQSGMTGSKAGMHLYAFWSVYFPCTILTCRSANLF